MVNYARTDAFRRFAAGAIEAWLRKNGREVPVEAWLVTKEGSAVSEAIQFRALAGRHSAGAAAIKVLGGLTWPKVLNLAGRRIYGVHFRINAPGWTREADGIPFATVAPFDAELGEEGAIYGVGVNWPGHLAVLPGYEPMPEAWIFHDPADREAKTAAREARRDAREEAKRRDLAARLTPEVLEVVREAVRVIGWHRDTVETHGFYRDLCELAKPGEEAGDCTPYDWDEQDEEEAGPAGAGPAAG